MQTIDNMPFLNKTAKLYVACKSMLRFLRTISAILFVNISQNLCVPQLNSVLRSLLFYHFRQPLFATFYNTSYPSYIEIQLSCQIYNN